MSKFPLSERSRRENSNTYVSIYIFSFSYNIPPNPLSIFLELSRWVGNVCELSSTKHSKGFHAANCSLTKIVVISPDSNTFSDWRRTSHVRLVKKTP